MAPDGSSTTLGEIAHIVARSAEGPRGDGLLPPDQRDDYDNLILLCPTHHRIVDDNVSEWPTERLIRMKVDHERWVANQLETGVISVRDLSGGEFLTNHTQRLIQSFPNASWIYAALTPLSITDEAINPKAKPVFDSINATLLPEVHCVSPAINTQLTRPSEFGLLNEDFRQLGEGKGHRIEIFRTGHIEMMICIEGMSQYITTVNRRRMNINRKFIHFQHMRDCLEAESDFLARIWQNALPFYNMVFSAVITDTEGTNLVFSSRRYSNEMVSPAMRSSALTFLRVVDKATTGDELFHSSLERFVESYGWVLPSLRDDDGSPSIPQALVTNT
jgi:hypothetical protein